MSRKQADGYDLDEDDGSDDQDIILAQDLEDAWEQKFQNFQTAPRVKGQCRKVCLAVVGNMKVLIAYCVIIVLDELYVIVWGLFTKKRIPQMDQARKFKS